MRKVAVIGFGLVGMIASQIIDTKKFEVHIFDLDNNLAEPSFFAEPDGPKSLRHRQSMPIGFPGNATFWGEAITNALVNKSSWSNEFIRNIPKYSKLLSKWGFPKTKLQWVNDEPVILRINKSDTHLLLKKIEKDLSSNSFKKHNSLVSSIGIVDDKPVIELAHQASPKMSIKFDFVILCAGAINSFNLISRSELIGNIEAVPYFDHPTIHIGQIRTHKAIYVNSILRTHGILFGRRPSAIVYRNDPRYSLTIRVKPLKLEDKGNENRLNHRHFRLQISTFLRKLGFSKFHDFSISITFDFFDSSLKALLGRNREINTFCYDGSSHQVTKDILGIVESTLESYLGKCDFFWNDTDDSEESAAAHQGGFLARSNPELKGILLSHNELASHRGIFIPGAISFQESVIGHPTYLALLSTIHSVEKINQSL